jgi:hypothetical protein
MRATRSRTITSLLAAAGGGFAVSAMIGAPTAVAEPNTTDCQPGQVVIDGQCSVPNNANNVPAPPPPNGTGGPGMGSGDHSGGYGR